MSQEARDILQEENVGPFLPYVVYTREENAGSLVLKSFLAHARQYRYAWENIVLARTGGLPGSSLIQT